MTQDLTVSKKTDPFGSLRAEWLDDSLLFELFSEPEYFPQLKTKRPCVLRGGRGTGKTTVLRCLSYDGQYALANNEDSSIPDWPYYGFYYRVNTNRVTAFRGPELDETQWVRVFAHYLNLLLCGQLIDFMDWFQQRCPNELVLSDDEFQRIALSLNLSETNSVFGLKREIRKSRAAFESFLNNLSPDRMPSLSLQGQPIDELCGILSEKACFSDKSLFFIIDEFENLLDYQQTIVNTLIKHAEGYSFKVGVRELGWRKKATLNPHEQLTSPADYELIDIHQQLQDGSFNSFATKICNDRIEKISNKNAITDVSLLFEDMTMEEEAIRLGVNVSNEISLNQSELDTDRKSFLLSIDPLEAFFVFYWSSVKSIDLAIVVDEARSRSRSWKQRYDNYKYSMLFLIRKGKSGIRKYYSGWRTLLLLSGGNIRFLLQLLYEATQLHKAEGLDYSVQISAETQTHAAQLIGKKNLSELEGLEVNGAQLTKLLLGLGRIFQVMAREMKGSAPEINQFHIPPDDKMNAEAKELLTSAVMHLALVRSTGNKLTDNTALKDYDYSIHPIFAPFFVFSHRKKRKMVLDSELLLNLVVNSRPTIKEILQSKNYTEVSDLPEQLKLFEDYYALGS